MSGDGVVPALVLLLRGKVEAHLGGVVMGYSDLSQLVQVVRM